MFISRTNEFHGFNLNLYIYILIKYDMFVCFFLNVVLYSKSNHYNRTGILIWPSISGFNFKNWKSSFSFWFCLKTELRRPLLSPIFKYLGRGRIWLTEWYELKLTILLRWYMIEWSILISYIWLRDGEDILHF